MLALLAFDRGPHVTTIVGEPLCDQSHRLARGTGASSDLVTGTDLTASGVQREQHPRPPDHRSTVHPGRGQPFQPLTVLDAQPDRVLHLQCHRQALPGREEGKKGKTLPKPRLDQKQPRLAATRY